MGRNKGLCFSSVTQKPVSVFFGFFLYVYMQPFLGWQWPWEHSTSARLKGYIPCKQSFTQIFFYCRIAVTGGS